MKVGVKCEVSQLPFCPTSYLLCHYHPQVQFPPLPHALPRTLPPACPGAHLCSSLLRHNLQTRKFISFIMAGFSLPSRIRIQCLVQGTSFHILRSQIKRRFVESDSMVRDVHENRCLWLVLLHLWHPLLEC